MSRNLPSKNAELRHAITHAAGQDPVLTAAVYRVAVDQSSTASAEEVYENLQARARAIVQLRPDLKDEFKGLLPEL